MQYLSAKEVAEKWGITPRRVQILCTEGRVEGAKQIGYSWVIPDTAAKPVRKRKGEPTPGEPPVGVGSLFRPLYALTTAPGHVERQIRRERDSARAVVLWAEYQVSLGEVGRLTSLADRLPKMTDVSGRISALHLIATASLYRGELDRWIEATEELEQIKNRYRSSVAIGRLADLVQSGMALNLQFPDLCADWLREGDLSGLPADRVDYARFVYAQYLYQTGRVERMLGAAEAYLEQATRQGQYLTALLWHVLAAVGYQATGETARALEHLRAAGELAEPDRILSPFVEFHSQLNGLDKTAFGEGPLYRSILNVWYGYRAGWSEIRTHQTKANLSRLLTDEEREIASLAAQGLSNAAVSERLGISQTTVRTRLNAVLEKTGLRSKDELRTVFRSSGS
jgi:DNA-binding CsgD family transcriptional regulator